MNADGRAMALVMLDLIGGSESDEALAERFGDHEAVAAGAAYLAGFAVEALALQRREPVPATVAFLRQSLGEGDDGGDGLGGVREPRRPHPAPGGAAAQATEE
jgi:hypothetical protein